MTRINANIDPADLCDQHLLAEYREIVRVPNHVLKHKIDVTKIPDTFRLGTGHVTFFYNKIGFLHYRFKFLKRNLNHRGIKNNIEDDSFIRVFEQHLEYFCNTNVDYANSTVVDRIIERIKSMKKVTMKGVAIDKEIYCQQLITKYGNNNI